MDCRTTAEKENFQSHKDCSINQSAAERLVQILTSDHITSLESIFKSEKFNEGMKKEEFFETMKQTLATDNMDELYLEFFDTYSVHGRLTWHVNLNALISAYPSGYDSRIKLEFSKITKNDLTERDSIAKILTIETTTHFCYTVYSKYGKTGIYDANFVKLATYHVILTREDINKAEEDRRKRNRWITDAVYLPDLKKIMVINTARSIVVYDVVGLKHTPVFLVLSTPNIPNGYLSISNLLHFGYKAHEPVSKAIVDFLFSGVVRRCFVLSFATELINMACAAKDCHIHHLDFSSEGTEVIDKCIAYKHGARDSNRHVFIGDDSGSVLVLSFVHNKEPLFRKKHNDKLSLHYWEKLLEEKEYVKISHIRSIHKDIIREIYYCQEDNTVTTCSRDPKASVIRIFLDHKKPTMIYEMPKGTSTMCFSKKLNLLITGSSDGTIRLWNTLVITNAIAVFKDHESGIKSIILMEKQKMFVSCDKSGIVRLWSVEEQKCYQTIDLKFPCLQEAGKIIDWASKCMFLGPRRKGRCRSSGHDSTKLRQDFGSDDYQLERSVIWISCCNYIASIYLLFDQNLQKQFDMPQLEPPPKQNNVFIPSTWLLSEESLKELKEKINCDIEYPEKFRDYDYVLHKAELKRLEPTTKINQKIALLDKQKREMQEHVTRSAPYLALKLFDIEELRLSYSLATHGKEEKSLMDKTNSLLADANNKDVVFSELSSSRSRSSRSSVMEFEY